MPVLGEKDAAIKEAERAITLLPSAKDAVEGPTFEEQLAFVEALVGDKNRAISTLQHLLEIPYNDCVTPALLRLDPKWDPLRGDPAFPETLRGKETMTNRLSSSRTFIFMIGLVAKQPAISKLRHSFVIRASAFEAYPARQARDLEAVKGLTNVAN